MELMTHCPTNHIYLKIAEGKIKVERIINGDILKISNNDIGNS